MASLPGGGINRCEIEFSASRKLITKHAGTTIDFGNSYLYRGEGRWRPNHLQVRIGNLDTVESILGFLTGLEFGLRRGKFSFP